MTNLPRVTQKIFGANATDVTRTIAQFGSVVAGSPLYTGDIATIQALQNWEDGWVGSTITAKRYPTAEETTGINKVLSQQIAYLLQKGIPEWDAGTIYYENDYVRVDEKLFHSLTDNNSNNNPAQDTINWKEATFGGGNGHEVGDYVWRSVPTEDDGKHLCDGALIQGGGVYDAFVNKIASLYNSLLQYATPVYNYNTVGTLTNTDGVLSGFSISNYATLPNTFNPLTNSLEMVFKFSLSTINVTNMLLSGPTNQYIHLYVNASNQVGLDVGNGSAWDFNGVYGTSTLNANTDYYIKVTFDGSQYVVSISTDGETWTQEIVQASTQAIPACQLRLGIARNNNNSLNGTIDLNKSYISIGGSLWWSGVTYNMPCFTDEATWQNTVATYGSCGKYVYDSVNNTVRLPRVSDILEGTTDLTALGDLIEAGLPNITGTFMPSQGDAGGVTQFSNRSGSYADGAFYFANTGSRKVCDETDHNYQGGALGIDASRVSSLYKNNFNKVQPQTIKALLYIVIATSTKTDIESDIDQIATDLNGKADTDLTNVTTTGRELINRLSIPRSGIALTLGVSESTYTAPSDGWFTLGKRANGTYQYVACYNYNTELRFCMTANFSGGECFIIAPARKGDVVKIEYNAGGEVVSFYFHPLTTT